MPADQTEQYLIVARLGAKYGVHGWQRLISFTQPATNILDYRPLFIQKRKQWQLLSEFEIKSNGDNLLIRIGNCHTPEQAKLYTGLEIAVNREQLPQLKDNEYYWSDLEGMQVTHQSGQVLGTVDYLFAAGTNDILVVKGERRRMIPLILGSSIVDIDLQNNIITVDWDPEL